MPMYEPTLTVLFTERIGALDRIVSLLRRRGFPVTGMSLERTHQSEVRRMSVGVRSKRIAVIGYGSQGHAHAQNLRDGGCDVRVGLYAGSRSWEKAERDGFTVGTVADVTEWAEVVSLLLPDQYHKAVFNESIKPHLTAGKMLIVAHGFSIHFGQIEP